MSEKGGGVLLINKLLNNASTRLKNSTNPSDSPTLDAELLLAHCLEKTQTYLHTWPEASVNTSQANAFEALLLKRLNDYPIAYLLGSQSFWTLNLTVTPDVLIPRSETELLVETALEKIANIQNPIVLDLGTGSGAIALAIASERPDVKMIATDYSNKALEIAIKNAEANELTSQITFVRSNWFKDVPKTKFDLIVSNPPYIAPNDPHLLQSIRYEPQQALVAENKGLKDIETIISCSSAYLKKGRWLLLEHGFDQGDVTQNLLKKFGFSQIVTLKDLSQNQRISCANFE